MGKGRFMTWLRIIGFLVIVNTLNLTSCNNADTSYIAFSLREATTYAQNGKRTTELLQLGGMTRIAGMVYDRENKDIILVGLKVPELPKARFDDLVVALRARFVHDEYPLVSIDPLEDTEQTKLQKVRFDGHIGNTHFGKNFLECDILLKLYSLQKVITLQSVPPYNILLEQDINDNVKNAGAKVLKISWHSAYEGNKLIENHHGTPVSSSESYQARFWFYAMEPYTTKHKEDVFIIKELQIGLKSEDIYQDKTVLPNRAREVFTEKWINNFDEVYQKYPRLKRLKILYDLVAVANAIRTIESQPYLEYLLKEYSVSTVPTDTTYKLEELYGVVERSDDLLHLVRISGGIEFKPEIKYLNYGDVTPLLSIVLNSRPSPMALTWTLPLKGWKMPNTQDLNLWNVDTGHNSSQFSFKDGERNGFSVLYQSVILNPELRANDETDDYKFRRFSGFPPPPPPPPPLKGVSMHMIVDEGSFKHESEDKLDTLREKTLKSRPSSDSLSWPSTIKDEKDEKKR
jgi:hypothetical protein